MRRHFRIAIRIWKILNEKYQVKSRKYGYGEIDVFVDVSVGLISSQGRVRSSKHCRSSIQGGHNSSFGNADGLLFQSLMNRDPIIRPHLIQFVDAGDPFVS